MAEERLYLEQLPEGINYPDGDPYILELKEKYPGTLWDRYLPSEVVIERIKSVNQELAKRNPERAMDISVPDLPPGAWVHNATWESEAREEAMLQAVKNAFAVKK